jgi:hypothetical protein
VVKTRPGLAWGHHRHALMDLSLDLQINEKPLKKTQSWKKESYGVRESRTTCRGVYSKPPSSPMRFGIKGIGHRLWSPRYSAILWRKVSSTEYRRRLKLQIKHIFVFWEIHTLDFLIGAKDDRKRKFPIFKEGVSQKPHVVLSKNRCRYVSPNTLLHYFIIYVI